MPASKQEVAAASIAQKESKYIHNGNQRKLHTPLPFALIGGSLKQTQKGGS